MNLEALERLGRLRASGAISEDEFISEKRQILDQAAQQSLVQTIDSGSPGPTCDNGYLPNDDVRPRSVGRVVVISLVSAVLLGAGGFTAYRYIAVNPERGSVAPAHYALRSQVKGIHIAASTKLSRNPHGDDSSCSRYEQAPVGRAAKVVASEGWHVTAEDHVGNLDAVSFVGACTPVSDTSFDPVDGNIGFYDGENLRAVVYGKKVGHIGSDGETGQIQIKNETGKVLGRILVSSKSISIKR